ncbi:hypothetical protein BD413DRAFT_175489 [Trametes elegans]|nr:hypothetical protein BD413DRAFT_175489 [Trametes elegans]
MSIRAVPTASASVTTVAKGGRFEQRSQRILREHLSMSLQRVGGRGDGGIDLQGWWWLPPVCLERVDTSSGDQSGSLGQARRRLRVVAQCKAEEKKIGPRYIRELEGTVLRHAAHPPLLEHGRHVSGAQGALVGLFISISPFTKASVLQAYSSPIPLALLHLPEQVEGRDCERDYDVAHAGPSSVESLPQSLPGTLVFNPALRSGLFRGFVEPRWERISASGDGRPGVWVNGARVQSWTPEHEEGNQQAPST